MKTYQVVLIENGKTIPVGEPHKSKTEANLMLLTFSTDWDDSYKVLEVVK